MEHGQRRSPLDVSSLVGFGRFSADECAVMARSIWRPPTMTDVRRPHVSILAFILVSPAESATKAFQLRPIDGRSQPARRAKPGHTASSHHPAA